MKIKKKSIVILHYSLSNSEGKLLETTYNGPPAQFVCGTGLFMPGFEDELIGLKAGDKKTIIIGPEKGYGMVNENLVLKVHRSELPEVDIKVGGTLWRESSNGDKIPFKINGFLDDWVFNEDAANDRLLNYFETSSLKGFGIQNMKYGIIAAGAILYYLDLTQHDNVKNITNISRIEQDKYVWLDKFTIRNLEILSPTHEGGRALIADEMGLGKTVVSILVLVDVLPEPRWNTLKTNEKRFQSLF